MAVFANTEKMYEVLGSLFNLLMQDKILYEKYVASNIVIKFTINDPEGFIWLTIYGFPFTQNENTLTSFFSNWS